MFYGFASRAHAHGRVSALQLVNHMSFYENFSSAAPPQNWRLRFKIKDDTESLFQTNATVQDNIRRSSYAACEKAFATMQKEINETLINSYNQGLGNRQAAQELRKTLGKLSTKNAERIAVTEINSAQNQGKFDTYKELGVGYHQWWSARDDRVRPDHQERHGEIVQIGDPFGNNLQYPGDRNHGSAKDWVWCRCTTIPFNMPLGKMAPNFTPFREEDLVDDPNFKKAESVQEALEQKFKPQQTAVTTDDITFDFHKKINPETMRNGIKWKDIKTPEDAAKFFNFKYYGKEKVWWEKDKQYYKFYDTENDVSIYFQTGLTTKKGLIDLNSLSSDKKNLKNILLHYEEAPLLAKQNTKTIFFQNRNEMGGMVNGDNCYYTSPSSSYYGQNYINIYKSCIEYPSNVRSNMWRVLYHEMGHSVDTNAINGLHLSSDQRWLNAMRVDEGRFCSDYPAWCRNPDTQLKEDVAEAISMVSFDPKIDRRSAILQYDGEDVTYDEWVELFSFRKHILMEALYPS